MSIPAGEVVDDKAVTGEAAAKPAAVVVPDEYKAEFEAHANRAAEAAARRTESRLKAEFAEQQRLAGLSEADRNKAETDALRAKVAILEGGQKFAALEKRVDMAAKSLGFVIPEVLEAELRSAAESGEEVNEEDVARRAFERSSQYLAAAGPAKPKPPTLNASARAGTPVGVADPANFSTMTEEAILAHANTLPASKGAMYLRDAGNFQLRGGKFAGQ